MRPVTKEEALQYEKGALQNDCDQKQKNIKIFEDAIAKEKEALQRNMQMIAMLEIHERDDKN